MKTLVNLKKISTILLGSFFIILLSFFNYVDAAIFDFQRADPSLTNFTADNASYSPTMSLDGRYIAFVSSATDLVADDTNSSSADVFLHDRQNNTTEIISVDSSGVLGNGGVGNVLDMSDDGRYIVFSSSADDLVAGDTNGFSDVFLHDTQTGSTTRVSVDSFGGEGDSESTRPSISSDGRYIAFDSSATNFVASDTNSSNDIFLHDTQTGATTRVSVDSLGVEGDAYSDGGIISSDGQYIIFYSDSTNLVVGDVNGVADVFLHDTQTGATTRVSVDSLGVEADISSYPESISSNGRYIIFSSESANLVAGDTNGFSDVFLHDTQTGSTTRVSVDSFGGELDGGSGPASISSNGRYIFFSSNATNLTGEDDNGQIDVFLHDTQTGDTVLITQISANGGSYVPTYTNSISSDGRYLVFYSEATNFVENDTNSSSDIFFYDTQDLELSTISISVDPQTITFQINGDIFFTKMSGNGQYIVFESDSTNIIPNDSNNSRDVFVHNTQTGITSVVSVSSNGELGNTASRGGAISDDGRYVAFYSNASNLVSGTAGNNYYLHDTQTGITTVASVDSLGDPLNVGSPLGNVRISGNGRYVAYDSHPSPSLPGGSIYGAYRYDTQTGETVRAAVDSLGSSVAGSVGSISRDGRYVFFIAEDNTFPGDTNGFIDAFMYDGQTGMTTLVSSNSDGEIGNNNSGYAIISDDGRYVFFESEASNLVPDDTNGGIDIFMRDMQTGEVSKISNNLGIITMYTYGYFNVNPTLSSDNRYFAHFDHLFDLETGIVAQIPGVYDLNSIHISANTKRLSFGSATSFVQPDTNGLDVFYSTFAFVSLGYSGNFTESTSNNGAVTGSRVVTITDDTFVNAGSTVTLNTHYTLSNVPAGLTPVMTVSGDGLTATLTFTGAATTHANANDVSNLTITFLDDAFTLESDADQVANNTNSIGVIDFQDPSGAGSSGGGGSNPNPVRGCTDSDADNYNSSATQDNGSCLYAPGAISGCTDSSAGNYNSTATVDNGSCLYGVFGCMDSTATNYNPQAVYSSGACTYAPPPPIDPPSDDPDDVNGCMDPGALNYNPLATVNSVACDYLVPAVEGCTDISATNYNEDATTNDGSCDYITTPPEEGEVDGGGIPGISGVTSFLKESPETLLILSVVGLAVPAVSPLLNPGNIAGIISIPIRIWNIIPTLLGFRRRKRPWGTVYDSVTKQPLDPVYVMLKDINGKDIATSITDLDGRYGFQVSPGQYSLFANKANYVFPSVKLAGKTEDELYDNLYFGGTLSVNEEDEIINKNIPMDALNFNWNEFEKAKNKKLMKFYSQTELFLARISKILFFAGLISSIILTIIDPRTLNLVILGLYALILILAFFGIKPKAFGFVTERGTGYPLSFGVISVFSSELGREVAHTVIGKTGRYYLLVPKGTYYIKLQKKTGEDTYEEVYQSESFNIKKGYINKIFKI